MMLMTIWYAMLLSSSVTAFMPGHRPAFSGTIAKPVCNTLRRLKLLHFPTRRKKKFLQPLKQSENDDDEYSIPPNEELLFDDFNFVIGEAAGSVIPPNQEDSLRERIQERKQQELYRDTKLRQNWKQGDWSVRGFSLDPADALHEASTENQLGRQNSDGTGNIRPMQKPSPIYVSKISPDVNSHGRRIWVGRSNGSLVWVQLGTDYTTHFRSKLLGEYSPTSNNDFENGNQQDSNDNSPSFAAKVRSELVQDMGEQSQGRFPDNDKVEVPPSDPFQILAQFSPANNEAATSPISNILAVPDEDVVFTTCEGSGQIQQWHISEDDIGSGSLALKTPVPLSEGIHNQAVVALKTVLYQDAPLILSVGADATLALWDINCDLIYHCQVSLEDIGSGDNSAQINPDMLVNCADVSENHIYLGASSGFVLGYDINDLLHSASSGGSCPLPQGKFRAHDEGVTAIAVGGPGSLGRLGGSSMPSNDSKTSSSVLLTGGGSGLVKQWEILSSPSMQKIENWPKLSTQRLPKKAHLFEGHDRPVTALESLSGRPQFLSASADGTIRAWNVAKGTEEYRMDGFTKDLSSICVQGSGEDDDDLLITNGMKQYVCVHDFSMGLSGESVDDYLDQLGD